MAKATGVPSESVRYDDRMPEELTVRITEIANVVALVGEYFKGDVAKTSAWFTVSNPMLGNVSPRDMIRAGRYKKLMQFIINAREGN